MIELPPEVTTRDGECVVVDQAGYELVLRSKSGRSGHRNYHKPCPDAAEDGEKRIHCKHGRAIYKGKPDAELIWRRRTTIDAVWTPCDKCHGEQPDVIGDPGGSHGTSLAHELASDDTTKQAVEAALQVAGE
jgi:hypothetical protein